MLSPKLRSQFYLEQSLQLARIEGLGPMTAPFIAIALRTWSNITTNKKRKALYQQYHRQIAIYQNEAKRFAIEQEEAIAAFKLKLVLKILSETLPPDGNNSRAWRGCSESTFQEHLEHFFPGKIRVGETVY